MFSTPLSYIRAEHCHTPSLGQLGGKRLGDKRQARLPRLFAVGPALTLGSMYRNIPIGWCILDLCFCILNTVISQHRHARVAFLGRDRYSSGTKPEI